MYNHCGRKGLLSTKVIYITNVRSEFREQTIPMMTDVMSMLDKNNNASLEDKMGEKYLPLKGNRN